MAEVRYCDLVQRYRTERVVTIGGQQGPPLGEGWTQIATLPASRNAAALRLRTDWGTAGMRAAGVPGRSE